MIKLVVFDLDNVIIDGEAIDEIGKRVDAQEKIVEITEKAMNGDLDFETSIKERVKLLEGVPVEEIKKVANELQLMTGAEETIKVLKDKGYEVAIISGNFDLIVDSIKDKLEIDHIFTNTLLENDGLLTGEVDGPLVKDSKYDVLSKFIEDKNLSLEECIAVGDGANDISMLEAAKYGIAFNAKPIVKEIADVIIENNDLRELLTIIDDLNMNADFSEIKTSIEDTASEDVKITENSEIIGSDTNDTIVEEDVVLDTESSEDMKSIVEEKDVESSESSIEESGSEKSDIKVNDKEKLPESSFEVADTPEGVRKQKDEREILIAKIADEREEFNKEAKEHRKIRDELNDSLKENLNLAIEFRDKRNEINKEVEENKKLRDKVNEELKNLEWSSGRRDRLKIENEIKKIDKIIETRVLDIKKENQLVKNANDLRKQLSEIQEDEKVKEDAQKLKKTSEEYHAVVVDLSEKAQESHENMLNYFKKTDEIRTNADEKHNLFIKARKAASAKHEEFKIVLSEIHQINKKLGTSKSKRRKSEKQSNIKKNREEKEKAEDIFDKFKKGKKLTTDELLLLQKHDIG